MRHDGMTFFEGISMLKEVGASGQISLGKKYAGQLFDMQLSPDGRVQLTPVKVVPAVEETRSAYASAASLDGRLTPERLARRAAAAARTPAQKEAARVRWEKENKGALEAMNQRMAKIGSMAARLYELRKAKSA
jgi:hypothetical protein